MQDKYNIKNYISAKHKHLLYKDECGDTFILTKHGEFYVYGNNTIAFNLISPKTAKSLAKCWYLNGDKLYQGKITVEKFQEYLKTIKQKQRIYKNKKVIFWKNRLAHDILIYKPLDFYPKGVASA